MSAGGYQLIQLVVQIVMARLLAPAEFGMLSVMLVFVNIGNVIVQSGLNTALVQSPDAEDSDFSSVFWMTLAISVLMYAIVFFAAPAIASFYEMDELIWPLRILAFIFIINAYNAVQVAKVQRELKYRKVFGATPAAVGVSGTLGIISAVNGAGIWALVIQQISYQLTNCVVLAFRVDWKPRLVFKPQRAGKLFRFGWKLLASNLLDVIYQNTSDLVIGRQFGSEDLGQVSQGKRYPHAIGNLLDGVIRPILLSAVSRAQEDIAYAKRIVRRSIKTSTYIVIPCMTALAVMAEPLVDLLLGEQWLPCVPFLQMYCFIYALHPINSANLEAISGMGRSDLYLVLQIIKKAFGFTAILITALVIRNIYAIVVGYMITQVFSCFVNAFPNRHVISYTYQEQLRDLAPGIVLSLVSGALVVPIAFLGLPAILQILIQLVLMVAIYLFLSKLFKVEEFSYLVEMAKGYLHSRKG